MSTASVGTTGQSSKKLHIVPLNSRKKAQGAQKEVKKICENYWLNLIVVILAYLLLYGFYFGFGYLWLVFLDTFAEDLLWGHFGLALACFGAMFIATVYSMSKQRLGWWVAGDFPNQEPCCVCCGLKVFAVQKK